MKKFFLLEIIFMLTFSTATAAKTDFYREILLSGVYTIRYENLTPAPRITNKNSVELYGKSGLVTEKNDFFINRPLSGIITSNGANRYEEVGYKDFFQCRLMIEDENFIFTRYKKNNGATEYYGTKKGEVESNTRNYFTEILNGESFGDTNFTEMMSALTDKNNFIFVKSDTLENGLTFEDFSADDGNKISAIRLYFSGDKLVKISFAAYGRDNKGKIFGNKYIAKILEFGNSADTNLLKLPAGLKDVTKR